MPKKQLTIEEKMNNALVPEEEWPYKLPDNWCWVRLGELFQVNPKNNVENDDIEAAFIPMALIDSDFSGEYSYEIKSWKEAKKGHTQFANKDVAFAKISPCFENGKAFIANNLPNGIGAGTTELVVLRNIKIVPQYTFYLLSTDRFVNGGRHTYSGVVGQQRISMDYVKSYEFPLPPLPEQQRIVARIESLFDKLDEAKEKVQNVLDGAENRKAAILHQAFTGKLTAKWRKENGVSDDSWEKKTLQEVCCTKITDGTHKTPKYSTKEDGGIPFISAKDVTKGMICWDNIKYIVPELHEELYKRLAPQRDDVLLAKNGTTGVAAIVETDIIFDLYVTLAVLRPNKEKVYPRFLLNIVNSPICKRQFDEHLTGIGVPNLHLRDIKEIEIGLPKLPEQQEIVRLLDQFLDKEKSICESCEVSLATIETMKKAILAKAFRGELGTNNPAEESSKELLREIISI